MTAVMAAPPALSWNYTDNYLISEEGNMKTYTMAELSRQTKAICDAPEPALITSNGKPKCMVLNIEDLPLDDALSTILGAWGYAGIREAQRRSVELGLDKMTLEEINEEIRQARLERHQREADGQRDGGGDHA